MRLSFFFQSGVLRRTGRRITVTCRPSSRFSEAPVSKKEDSERGHPMMTSGLSVCMNYISHTMNERTKEQMNEQALVMGVIDG